MKKLKRWINIVSMILVLVPAIIVGALFAAVSLIDFNKYKPQIEQEIAAKTGRDFKIHGEVKVSAIPLQFKAEKIEFSTKDKNDKFATADKVSFRLSLLHLVLKQQANIRAIELINLKANLLNQTVDESFWQAANDKTQQLDLNISFENFDYQADNKSLTVKNLSINEEVFSQDFALNLQNFALKADLTFAQFNPKKLLQNLNIPLPNFQNSEALTSLNGGIQLTSNQEVFELSQIDLTLDQTKLTGSFANFISQEKFEFALNLDQLNMDFYQAIASEKQAVKQDEATTKQTETPAEIETYLPLAVPVSTLRDNQINGEIKIGQLQILNGKYQNLTSEINAEYGQIKLAPFDFELYQGSATSQITVNVNGDTPEYKLSGKLKNIDNQIWLRDITGFDKLSGRLNSHFNLTTRGSNLDAIKYNLHGRFNAEITDGSYQQIDINRILTGKSTQPGDATKISHAVVQGDVLAGIFHLQNSSLTSDNFKADLLGKVNIPQALFQNEVLLTYSQPPAELSLLKGVKVPIKLEGEIQNPNWIFDLEGFLKPENINQVLERFFGKF